jgi:hypothetical protein
MFFDLRLRIYPFGILIPFLSSQIKNLVMELGIGYFKVIICQTILFVYIKLIGILKRFVTKS